MQNFWLALLGAIIVEVVATLCLKLSDGMTKPLPSMVMLLGYGVAFYLLAYAVREIELSIAYAIWAGLGILLTSLAGVVLFGESLSWAKAFSTGLIIAGVIGLFYSQPST